MADINETVPANEGADVQQDLPQEVQQQMQQRLGMFNPETVVEEPKPEVVVPDAAPVNPFDTIKEKFGYQSHEDAIREIEELRNLRSNPVREEIKFENEVSERIFRALQEGKTEEVYGFLAKQNRLSSLTSSDVSADNAAEIIKLGMQLENADLTPAEIDFQFRRQYAVPKEPQKTLDEDDDEFEARHRAWKESAEEAKMALTIAAKLAKPKLIQAQQNLSLPEVNNNVDAEYDQWRKSLEELPRIQQETKQAYSSFKPTDIQTKQAFIDEANGINFEFEYVPEANSFQQSVDVVTDADKLQALFTNPDGTPNRKEFLEAMHFALNRKAILAEAMKQAKNATIKAQLPDNTSGGMLQRSAETQVEESEFDRQMKARLNPYLQQGRY
jgi:hypothetical protein